LTRMVDSVELLRTKALLLLRRERELNQLQQERSRVELWLEIFQSLSLGLHSSDVRPILEHWVEAMVSQLTFQVAAIYVCVGQTDQLSLMAGVGPTQVADRVTLSEGERRYLLLNSSGLYSGQGPAELRRFADYMRLGRFNWLQVTLREQTLLFLAGFAAGSERFNATKPRDFDHFVSLGTHVAALVSKAALIAELDREKSELLESNTQLDINVHRLSEAQDELVASGKRLAEASRRAGMADIATGVLHNVGNALNSISVSSEMLQAGLRALRVDAVTRTAALLQQNSADLSKFLGDPGRGGQLPKYLAELGEHFARERDRLLSELNSLLGHVEHVKAIVSKQQLHAMSFDTSQRCSVRELIEDAVSLAEYSLTNRGIAIEREYDSALEIVVDRHKVLQILVNLLKNAQDALLASGEPAKRIAIRLTTLENGNARITVRDNGVGIAPEELDRLFAFGFTTKRGGHGFGLHACAIAAEELKGTLRAQSDGRGKGASFTLELPARR
jgi:two-component system NtrC family sensor kinase